MTTELRLIDIIAALKKREAPEAQYYEEVFLQYVSLIYDVDPEELLYMTVNDISKLELPPEKPLKYEGWDNFWFGRAAFANSN